MKKLTKFLAVLLCLTMLFAFTACNKEETKTTTAAEVTTQVTETTAAATTTAAETTTVTEEPVDKTVIRLSTTTSVNDSGLLPYLQPYFEKATGYKLEVTSAGTGAAIEKARTGDADCLLVHSKSQEEAYINEGYDEVRVPFMYNYFVIVGPESDPAKVSSADSASAAFKAIADSKSTFISRGDASGTHTKELAIWVAAGLLESAAKGADGNYPVIKADWYQSIGQGMGATLNMAQEKQCYTLSDKATFLAHEDTLKILLERSDEMMNTYSMIAVSPKRFADTNYEGAQKFIEWMQSDEAKQLIAAYGVDQYGEALFYNLEK